MGVFPDVLTEMAVLLLLAAGVGALCVRLRQPLIVAFIAVGILVGPSVLGWVNANDRVDLLAKLGISLLLFAVGLKLDLYIIRTMGPMALATGLGQVAFTSIIGYLIALALGMTPIAALYVAVALTFSSTIIIVKLLSDKREVDTLHGRIAVTAHGPTEVARLEQAGADLVLVPYADAAREAANRLLGQVSPVIP